MALRLKPVVRTPKDSAPLSDFFKTLELSRPSKNDITFYRGHDVADHIMQPALFREKSKRKYEKNLLRELVMLQPSEFANDQGVFERLVRMQHYSLRTRLLDITLNPLVALYFACNSRFSEDGEVIQIRTREIFVKYYDSDTVSCVANLSNLSGRERDQLRELKTDKALADSLVGDRLLQFIKSEKPYFMPRIQREHLDGPTLVKPKLTNRRLLAQQGAFLLFGLQTELADINDTPFHIERTRVPASSKRKIRESLDKVGVNTSTMFPEIESAAQYVMSKVTADSGNEEGS